MRLYRTRARRICRLDHLVEDIFGRSHMTVVIGRDAGDGKEVGRARLLSITPSARVIGCCLVGAAIPDPDGFGAYSL